MSARARSRDAASPLAMTTASSRDFFMGPSAGSIPSPGDPVRDGGQLPLEPRGRKRGEAPLDAVRRHAARRVETEERRIGGLAGGGVLAGRLSEIRGGSLDVEDVVHDLE